MKLSAALLYILWLRDELPVWAWGELEGVAETVALFAAVDVAAAEHPQTTVDMWKARVLSADTSTLLNTAVMLSTMAVFG